MSERARDELARIQAALRTVPDPLAMLESIFTFAPMGLQVLVSTGHSILVNRVFREIFGAEPPPDYCVFKDEIAERAGVNDIIRRAFSGETVNIGPTWYDARELEHVHVESARRVAIDSTFFPLFDDGGRVTHVAIMHKDVTAELLAREARERSLVLENVTADLAGALSEARIGEVLMSRGLPAVKARRALFGLRTADGASIELVAHHGFASGAMDRWARFPIDAATPLSDALRRNTAIWLESGAEIDARYPTIKQLPESQSGVAVPLEWGGEARGALGFDFAQPRAFSDDDKALFLTLGRLAAQALERAALLKQAQVAAARAEQANRAKDEFLSIVSHELRTPLNAINGWANVIASGKHKDPAVVERGISVILRNVRAQVTIIDDILDMSRIVAGKLRLHLDRTGLRDIVAYVVESARPNAISKGISLTFEAEGEGLVAGDAERLQQIASNLLTNAMKFTEDGGRIAVSLRSGADLVTLSVRDSGRGIAAADLPFIFDRFRQADSSLSREKGGLGLGLAIVKQLVEAHGGHVKAASDGAGRGATFVVTLPALQLPARSGELRASHSSAPPVDSLQDRRVLVVDDEVDSADIVAVILRDKGAEVKVAYSTSAAMALLATFEPDVFVNDLSMPGEDGFSLLARIRSSDHASRDAPAIALTAYARAEDAERALAEGFLAHVAKPVDPSDLVRVLAAAIRRTSTRPR